MFGKITSVVSRLQSSITTTAEGYLSRRPHRSFRRSRARDYQRSLQLPGYWALTVQVVAILRRHFVLFIKLIAVYAILGAIFVGLSSQDSYAQLSDLLDTTGSKVFSSGWGTIGQAGLLLFAGLSGGLSQQLTDVQQIYSALILLLTWLTTVWLLRSILAGKRPTIRDGLYNAGAPIVSTGIVLLALIVQLLPGILAIIVASSAASTSVYENGFMAMIVTVLAGLFVVLSAYWSVATFIALIVVTLPGMYPLRALRTAGDIAIGRRVRLLLRLLWMIVIAAAVWLLVVLIMIIFVRGLSIPLPWINSIPIIPIVMSVMSSVVVVWSAAYIYILYRKVVEDDAQPA